MVAARLLPVLTQQCAIAPCLAHVDAWRTLLAAFAEQATPIRALAGPTARALAKALTVASGALPDEAAAAQYTHYLMHAIAGEAHGKNLACAMDVSAGQQYEQYD